MNALREPLSEPDTRQDAQRCDRKRSSRSRRSARSVEDKAKDVDDAIREIKQLRLDVQAAKQATGGRGQGAAQQGAQDRSGSRCGAGGPVGRLEG